MTATAFDTLYTEHQPAALRYARYLRAGQDAEDVVAEVFSRIYNRDNIDNFRAYLMQAVRREVWRRHELAARTRPTDTFDDQAAPDGLDYAEADAVRSAFGRMPSRWREVLVLLEVEGRRPREVADQLGLTPNAVSALAVRARRGLRAAYEDMLAGVDE